MVLLRESRRLRHRRDDDDDLLVEDSYLFDLSVFRALSSLESPQLVVLVDRERGFRGDRVGPVR